VSILPSRGFWEAAQRGFKMKRLLASFALAALTASPRYFTGGLAKLEAFSKAMNENGVAFVVELGDYTDNPANSSLPADQRRKAALGFMEAAEAKFAMFKGPRYHVIGNHDNDQASKADFLSRVANTGIAADATYYSFEKSGIHFIVLDAAFDPKHSVKNAAAVRSLLEQSKKVLAVFSGHYHDGGYQEVNGIRYVVLQANAAYGNGMQRSYVFTRSLE
jgi:alkaline phosphatase